MNRRFFLVSALAILTLLLPSIVMISPSNAGAIISEGQATYEVWLVDEGKVWEAGGILHMKDSYYEGPSREQWVKHLSLNLETGHGTFRVKWVTAELIEGKSAIGIITDKTHISGTYVCHGTGYFKNVNLIGTFEGEIEYNEDGLPVYMRFEETGKIIIPPSSPAY